MSSVSSMETMPKAWRLCQKHGNPAKEMETMPKAMTKTFLNHDMNFLANTKKKFLANDKKIFWTMIDFHCK